MQKCIVCDKEFETSNCNRKFCSDECFLEYELKVENEKNKNENDSYNEKISGLPAFWKKYNNSKTSFRRKKYCLQCGILLSLDKQRDNFCSDKCRINNQLDSEKKLNIKSCTVCNSQFIPKTNNQKFCSTKCREINSGTYIEFKEKICEYCGEKFSTKRYNQRFCSVSCRSYKPLESKNKAQALSKKKQSSALEVIVRDKVESIIRYLYSQGDEFNGQAIDYWSVGNITESTREEVLNRDNHQCQVCMRNTNLHLHHLVKRKNGGSHDANNLITLCASCHRSIETGDVDHAVRKCLKNANKYFYNDEKIDNEGYFIACIVNSLEKAFDELETDDIDRDYLTKLDSIIDLLENIK